RRRDETPHACAARPDLDLGQEQLESLRGQLIVHDVLAVTPGPRRVPSFRPGQTRRRRILVIPKLGRIPEPGRADLCALAHQQCAGPCVLSLISKALAPVCSRSSARRWPLCALAHQQGAAPFGSGHSFECRTPIMRPPVAALEGYVLSALSTGRE